MLILMGVDRDLLAENTRRNRKQAYLVARASRPRSLDIFILPKTRAGRSRHRGVCFSSQVAAPVTIL